MALIEPQRFYDTSKFPTEPGILRVNRQIQAEAMPMFDNNTFRICIVDLRPEIHRWYWQRTKLSLDFDGWMDWRNFKHWLKDHYEGKTLQAQILRAEDKDPYARSECQVRRALDSASRIVEAMKDDPWDKVEVVLEAFREGIDAWSFGGRPRFLAEVWDTDCG